MKQNNKEGVTTRLMATMVPNVFFRKEVLGPLSANELKLLLAIIRKTYGWHKDVDKISRTQVEAMTGIRCDKVKAAREGLKAKLGIDYTLGEDGQPTAYTIPDFLAVGIAGEAVPNKIEVGSVPDSGDEKNARPEAENKGDPNQVLGEDPNQVLGGPKSGPARGPKSGPTKERVNKLNKRNKNTAPSGPVAIVDSEWKKQWELVYKRPFHVPNTSREYGAMQRLLGVYSPEKLSELVRQFASGIMCARKVHFWQRKQLLMSQLEIHHAEIYQVPIEWMLEVG